MTGAIPLQLRGLTALKRLAINDNPFTGALPSTLTALRLNMFWYDETDVCEPGDAGFQAWLGGIVQPETYRRHLWHANGCGTVWDDQNRNGGQDVGEPPLPGLTVTLTANAGSLLSIAAGRQVVTDVSGQYRFHLVSPGAYTIAVSGPGGYLPTAPGPVAIVVPAEGDVTVPPIGLARASAHVYLPLIRR